MELKLRSFIHSFKLLAHYERILEVRKVQARLLPKFFCLQEQCDPEQERVVLGIGGSIFMHDDSEEKTANVIRENVPVEPIQARVWLILAT